MGKGIVASACAVLVSDKLFLFLGRVILLPIGVDRKPPILACVHKNMSDFILGDAMADFRQLRHIGMIFVAGQVQFVQTVHQLCGAVIAETKNLGIRPPSDHKLPKFFNQGAAGFRLFQKPCDLFHLIVKCPADIAIENRGKITALLCFVAQVAGEI